MALGDWCISIIPGWELGEGMTNATRCIAASIRVQLCTRFCRLFWGGSLGEKRGIIRIFARIIANGDENRAELFVGGTQHVPPPGQDSLVYGVCVVGGIGAHPEG